MESKFYIEVYDRIRHLWLPVCEYSTKKIALHKFNEVKKCFPTLKYRMYEKIYWRLK